jgi:hypothetical protein
MANNADTSLSRRQLVGAGATLAATSLASSAAKGNEGELGSIYVQLAAADAGCATCQVYGASGGAAQP